MTDRVLDRLVEFDERSRNFPVRALLPLEAPRKPRSYSWRCTCWLDQGREGACVGFAWAHELIARPSEVPNITAVEATAIYYEARRRDQFNGENYQGTSVLGGIKAVQALYADFIHSYHWAFGLEDVAATLGYHGPVVLGVNWYEGMFDTDASGFIHATGKLMGGHAILAHGVDMRRRCVALRNSWGKSWGKEGDCYLSFDDLRKLLSEDGEACVPTDRKRLPRAIV